MRAALSAILGLAVAGPVSAAVQPSVVSHQGDAFDRLSSSFIIRDWISFARDEHDRLEGVQIQLHPRFSSNMLNTDTAPAPAVAFNPMPLWDVVASLIEADSMQYVPDPIASRIPDRSGKLGLRGILGFERPITLIRGTDLTADLVE